MFVPSLSNNNNNAMHNSPIKDDTRVVSDVSEMNIHVFLRQSSEVVFGYER